MGRTEDQIVLPTRALLLGVMGGARSMTPLAMLALNRERPALQGAWRDWPVFSSPVGRGVLVAAALGELVGDKLPMTPSRLAPGPLFGRVLTQTVAGAALGSTYGGTRKLVEGAAFGAAGGLIGSYLGYLLRVKGVDATGLPDALIAVIEDAITFATVAAVLAAD